MSVENLTWVTGCYYCYLFSMVRKSQQHDQALLLRLMGRSGRFQAQQCAPSLQPGIHREGRTLRHGDGAQHKWRGIGIARVIRRKRADGAAMTAELGAILHITHWEIWKSSAMRMHARS